MLWGGICGRGGMPPGAGGMAPLLCGAIGDDIPGRGGSPLLLCGPNGDGIPGLTHKGSGCEYKL